MQGFNVRQSERAVRRRGCAGSLSRPAFRRMARSRRPCRRRMGSS